MAGGEAAPEFTVFNLDGSIRFVAKGYPWLDVTADPETVHLTLDDVDTSIIGPGRFTYSLVVSNEYRETRTLLTGMMLVEEGAYVEPYRR